MTPPAHAADDEQQYFELELVSGSDAHPLVPWLTPRRRAYLYRVASAALLAALACGLLGAGQVADILGIVAAVLAVPVAALHTPTST